jgi:hypothetical protein
MAIGNLDTEPGGQAIERVAGEIRLGHFGKKPRVECVRARPVDASPFAFTLKHGEIEAERVPDDHGATDEGGKLGPDVGEGRGIRDRRVVDAMDPAG